MNQSDSTTGGQGKASNSKVNSGQDSKKVDETGSKLMDQLNPKHSSIYSIEKEFNPIYRSKL